jgi:nitrogen fixation NifU-like protein
MDLYQEIILEHSKRPLHAGLREPFAAEVHHVNPTCGDEVTLRVQIDGEGRSAVVSDVVLADEVIGHSVKEALAEFAAMRKMLTSKGADPGDEDEIGDGVAFAGVSKYPARVKCALLGWMAFTDALTRAGVDISATSASHADPPNSDDADSDDADSDDAGSDNTIGDKTITSTIISSNAMEDS